MLLRPLCYSKQGNSIYPRRHPLILSVFLCFFVQFCALATDYLIDAWDSEKGLPDNFVTSIAQTPEGYLWVGTYGGLARFDGIRFETFKPENTPQLGHSRIVKLFLDARGTLWINTYDGSLISWRNGLFTREWDGKKKGMSEAWVVESNRREIIFSFRCGLLLRRSFADGKSNVWHTLMPPGSPPGAYYCVDRAGTLWCSTLDGQLWRIVDNKFTPMPKDSGLDGQEIHWLTHDPFGRIWVGTDKQIAMWNGIRFQNESPPGNTNLNVAFVYFTKDGSALVAANGLLRKYSEGKWIGRFEAWPDLMQEQQLQFSVNQDSKGGIWRVSRGLGIFHISPDGRTEQITSTTGLPGDHTTCCFEDHEGNIWLGLGNNGLARLRKKYFEVVKTDFSQNRPAMSVCEDKKGNIWIGTYGGGLNRLQNGRLKHYEISALTPGDFVFSIYPAADDSLWISGGMEDSFVFENGEVKPAPVFVHGIKSILADSRGNIWMGRKDGVDRWAGGQLKEWNSHNGSISRPVRTIVEDVHSNIWIGADDGNIYLVEGDNLHAVSLPNYATQQAVWSMTADPDGSLWIGTSDSGLLHFENGHFSRFTATDGLPGNLICQILDDKRGNLWLGSHKGICRVSKTALSDFASHKTSTVHCTLYDKSDGLPTLQCTTLYQPSAWRSSNGTLWFATAKGVVSVHPSNLILNTNPPTVVVEEFLVDGKTQHADEAKAGIDTLRIEPGKQNFEFRYTALSLTASEKIRFQYKLEGFDSDWINADTRRWVQYNYLKPNSYCFRVRACNSDGVWNETGTSMRIRILPHFWETWEFKSSLSLIFAVGIIAIVRYISRRELRMEVQRVARQRDLEQDRARIARDIHDHVGSGLTRINLLSELLLGDSPAHLPERAGQITEATYDLMQSMDEIVWAVNPKNDSLDSLVNYLCDFADEFLRMADIRFRINLPSPLPVERLTPEVRHNLFLAVKEILNNIVKHSDADEVFFELQLNDVEATLEIRDNGRGFSKEDSVGCGNGLGNLERRARGFGGFCRIASERGKGTRVQLVVPTCNLRKN